MLWVEELGVYVFGSEEVAADDEDFGGDVSSYPRLAPQATVKQGAAYLDEGGFVASTLPNS